MSYDAIYQARSTNISNGGLDAFVPQVFGDTPVRITLFTGTIPTATGMGWVLFQGGDPAYPVWTGSDSNTSTPGSAPPTILGLPIGGLDGQVLTKQSANDYDALWETIPDVGTTPDAALQVHIVSTSPHPYYDDQPSLILLFENKLT